MMRSATRRATLAVPSARSIVSTSSLPSSSRLLATHAAPGVTSAGHDFKADEHHDDHHHDDHHHEDGPTGYLWSRQVSAPPRCISPLLFYFDFLISFRF
jgi:hypothetical protein